MGEHTAVGKERDLGDLAAGEGEYEQPVRARDLGSWAREVAAEGGLTVGARGDEPQRPVVACTADAEEVLDCPGALVLVGVGRHGQPRVVGEQRDDRVDVAVLERVRKLPDYFALVRGVGQRRSVTPPGGQAALEG